MLRSMTFKKQLKNGIEKGISMEWLESRSIIAVDAENDNACINYLLFHSFTDKGLVRFINSLYFYLKLKKAALGLCTSPGPVMKVYVNYGKEDNPYGKTGMLPQFKFSGSRFLKL